MKKGKWLLLVLLIVIVAIICIIVHVNKSEIKTIKSEKQLMQIYKNEYGEMSLAKKMITLPFSIFFNDNHYYYGQEWSEISTYDDAKIQSVNDSSARGSTTKDYSKTNIQVEGVDEADIIKTDGDYIYSISENKVIISNVKDPKNIKIESRISVGSSYSEDLILYKDYLVVISSSNVNSYYQKNTLVNIYNIKNKAKPKLEKEFELYEPYFTTRCIDGKLYIFSKGTLREKNNKIERKYKEDYKTKEIELKNIKYLKDNTDTIQTLIAEVDLNKIENIKLNSYLMDISNAYISKKNIYLLDEYNYGEKVKISSLFTFKGIIGFFYDLGNRQYGSNTYIYKFNIDEEKGVVLKNTTQIKGNVVNQYSLDEKDDNLRIALETEDGTRISILDKKLHLIGETDPVAEDEKMYASRFIGDKAYLVTYKNMDPLFVIDLSDPKNPEVLGELEIPGYSTYLHPYDENHLIGIGMDTNEEITRDINGKVTSSWSRITGMKMCLFDVSDVNNPVEVAKTTIGDSRTVSAIISNPKALLFSKEKNLLAIPVNNYNEDFAVKSSEDISVEIDNFRNNRKTQVSEGYFVYNVDLNGFDLKGIITHETKSNKYNNYRSKLLRGVYIDDNLYTVSEDSIKVNKLSDLSEISSINIKSKGVDKNDKEERE